MEGRVTNLAEAELSQHYSKLKEKMNEKKPNPSILSQLLDLEVKSRRNYIESLSSLKSSSRVENILKAYPCFTTPVHVLEEMQRELKESPPFLPSRIGKISKLWEKLFMYGVYQKVINVSDRYMDSDLVI